MRCWVFLTLSLMLGVPAMGASPDEDIARANLVLDHLTRGEPAKVVELFDATMSAALPADKLAQTWDSIVAQVGALRERGKAVTARKDDLLAVEIPCTFERAALVTRVVFNREGRVAGLFFRPGGEAPAPPPVPSQEAAKVTEQELSAGAKDWPLPATLSLPRGTPPFPAVVLVHGSGPQDRDETVGGVKVFRDLASGLASRGVAVLRYEKRSRQHASRMASQPITVKEEVIDDAAAGVALLRTRKEIDPRRVFVLGHSLGGSLIPRIARAASDVAGLIVLEGATRPVEELVLEQTRTILERTGAPVETKKAEIAKAEELVRQLRDPGLASKDPKTIIFGAPVPYWLDLRGYQPAREAASLPQPMLILQGERDYQVTMTDFGQWKAALGTRKDVTFRSYPKLNHLGVEGDGPSVPAEYEKPGHVFTGLIDDIARWVRERPAR